MPHGPSERDGRRCFFADSSSKRRAHERAKFFEAKRIKSSRDEKGRTACWLTQLEHNVFELPELARGHARPASAVLDVRQLLPRPRERGALLPQLAAGDTVRPP